VQMSWKKKQAAVALALGVALSLGNAGCTKDDGVSEHNKSPDNPQPLLLASIDTPAYGGSNIHPDASIRVTVHSIDRERTTIDEAYELLKADAIIESYPAQKPVSGTWSITQDTAHMLGFTPSQPWEPGDYLLRFPKGSDDIVIMPRPYNLFRVGKGVVRLTTVVMHTPNPEGSFAGVELVFSEGLPATESTSFTVERSVAGAWTAVNAIEKTPRSFVVATAISKSDRVRVTVSGSSIDGNYTGIAGSAAVTAEFVPQEHLITPDQVMYYVPPKIPVTLP